MFEIVPMTPADCGDVLLLWAATDGIAILPDVDTPERLCHFLERNPTCSFVARGGGEVVGSALGGHDARRGFLYHVAVAGSHRGLGLGRRLAERSLGALRAAGVSRVHLFVLSDNEAAKSFWRHLGFYERTDLTAMSINLSG